MKNLSRVAELHNAGNGPATKNTLILRNYNDGRNGGWDNYCCYKGKNPGTYVNHKPEKDDQ